MRLSSALEIRPRDIVTFVGAGGKTSAMFRLARELVEEGYRVVTSTTTRIARDELALAPHALEIDLQNPPPPEFVEILERDRHLFLYSTIEGDKVRGVTLDWLAANLGACAGCDAMLIEGDGTRRLPFKAPYPHEPVIPSATTLVIPVAGLVALGQPLNDTNVYGVPNILAHLPAKVEAPITPEMIGATLLHPQLGMKNIPRHARVIPLLNRVTSNTLDSARSVARLLLSDMNVHRVLIGTVLEEPPIWEVQRRVGAVVLAAGQSTRMGQPKVLLPWGEGTMIRHICEQVLAIHPYEVVVVAGEHLDAIKEELKGLPLRVVYNPRYAEGEMLSSLQTGLEAIWSTSDACLVILGDQPAIAGAIVQELLDVYAQGKGPIVAPVVEGQRGHPLIIQNNFWQALMELPAGAAPRDMLQAHQEAVYQHPVSSSSVLMDIDTPEDYQSALKRDAEG